MRVWYATCTGRGGILTMARVGVLLAEAVPVSGRTNKAGVLALCDEIVWSPLDLAGHPQVTPSHLHGDLPTLRVTAGCGTTTELRV